MVTFVTHGPDGELDASGDLDEVARTGSYVSVPTAGSISVEIVPGRWLSVVQSEWASVYLSDKPIHHENQPE